VTADAVLFVIDPATRRVEIAGILRKPDSAWVVQCGRQLTDPDDGCLRQGLDVGIPNPLTVSIAT
jgi:hypothetical protein